MRKYKNSFFCIIIALFTIIPACNEEEKTNQENNVPECILDNQCPADKPICKDDKCIEQQKCINDIDCRQNETCNLGKCIEKSACEDKTKISCNDQCIDPLIDNDNCGKCGIQCHKDETCLNGRCAVSCQYYDLVRCENSDECVNLSNDSFNCGSCGNKCKTGEKCVDSSCSKIDPCDEPSKMECRDKHTLKICGNDKQWLYAPCKDNTVCSGGECVENCIPGSSRCSGNIAEICSTKGTWTSISCSGSRPLCNDGKCVACIPGDKQCSDNIARTCTANSTWISKSCLGSKPICNNGECVAQENSCTEGEKKCNGLSVQTCTNGTWITTETCSGSTPVCSDDKCICAEGTVKCANPNTVSICTNGAWIASTCPNETPVCSENKCVCAEGTSKCSDNKTLQICIEGIWGNLSCTETTPICSVDKCVECSAGSTKCLNGTTLQTCINGVWSNSTCSPDLIDNSREVRCELGVCKASSCLSGYHVEENSCVPDTPIIIFNKNISGYSQKGPFMIGSTVTVQELTQNLVQTGNSFRGKIQNSKGAFSIASVELASQYALLEVNGYYRNEVTGENSSSPIVMTALSDLSDRDNVNINIITHLETERLMQLVSVERMAFSEAKIKAQTEIMAAFGFNGNYGAAEDMNIFNHDEKAAILLAISILMQGDLDMGDFVERINNLSVDLMDGTIDNVDLLKSMALWTYFADLNVIRQNIESWDENIPNFEKYIAMFRNSVIGTCEIEGSLQKINTGFKFYSEYQSMYFICKDGTWKPANEQDLIDNWFGICDETDAIVKANKCCDLSNGYVMDVQDIPGKCFREDSNVYYEHQVYYKCTATGWRVTNSYMDYINYEYGKCNSDRNGEAIMVYDKLYWIDMNGKWIYECKENSSGFYWYDVPRNQYNTYIPSHYSELFGPCSEENNGKVKYIDFTADYYACDESGWREANEMEIVNYKFGACNEDKWGVIKLLSTNYYDRYYACGEDGWHIASQSELLDNKSGRKCEVGGENVATMSDVVTMSSYGVSHDYACTNKGWIEIGIATEACVTEGDVCSSDYWSFSVNQYIQTGWYWYCHGGQWELHQYEK